MTNAFVPWLTLVSALTVGLVARAWRPTATGVPAPSPSDPYPAAIGDGVQGSGHAYWPVRVRSLERVKWRSKQGGEASAALPGTDGLLRVLGGGGGLRGMNPADGSVKWVAHGNHKFWNYSAAVLGADGTAYFGNVGFLTAADRDGKQLWRTDVGASWLHAPPALSPDGATVYVGGDDLGLAALDAKTGALRWLHRDFKSAGTSYAFDADGELVAAIRGEVRAFRADGTTRWTIPVKLSGILVVGELLVGHDADSLRAFDLTTRAEKWRLPLGAKPSGIALGDDGLVRAALADGRLAAVGTAGVVEWTAAVGTAALGRPVACRDGETIVADAKGVVSVVGPGGRIVSSIATGVPARWGRPAVLPDGSVVVNGTDELVSIDGRER